MQEPYRYETLPLDTPDDDPRWKAYADVFRAGFLDRRPSEAGVVTYRGCRRADSSVMGMVTAEGPGIEGRGIAGAFVSAGNTVNDGRGLVGVEIINTIAVRPSHRRRGILTEMMRQHLDAALAQRRALAVLTASEGTIYGRYGFGIASRSAKIAVDTTKFAFAPGVEVSRGVVEFVDPSFLEPHFERIREAHQARHRGAVGVQEAHRLYMTGKWDGAEEGPSRALRAAVHFGDDGTPDGYAVFKHQGWDSTPITTQVVQLCAPDPAVQRALWLALANTDLVERLTYESSYPHDPLPASLVDSRAVQLQETSDDTWLRILDLPGAAAGRGFDHDGAVVVDVADAAGYCAGTWRLSAEGGVGSAVSTDSPSGVRLDVATLAMLWFGDRTAMELARAGRITGSAQDILALSTLMATHEPPVNLAWF